MMASVLFSSASSFLRNLALHFTLGDGDKVTDDDDKASNQSKSGLMMAVNNGRLRKTMNNN